MKPSRLSANLGARLSHSSFEIDRVFDPTAERTVVDSIRKHMLFSAQSRRPTVILDAAVRLVEGDIHASRSILYAET